MSDKSDWLRSLLARVYAAKWADAKLVDFASFQEKFVFHMVDAAAEVRRLNALLVAQNEPKAEDFAAALHQFFLHAVPHLMAAGELYDYIPEIFPEQNGVHSLADDGREGA